MLIAACLRFPPQVPFFGYSQLPALEPDREDSPDGLLNYRLVFISPQQRQFRSGPMPHPWVVLWNTKPTAIVSNGFLDPVDLGSDFLMRSFAKGSYLLPGPRSADHVPIRFDVLCQD